MTSIARRFTFIPFINLKHFLINKWRVNLFTVIILFSISLPIINAQQTRIDSLEAEFTNAQNNEQRLNILTKLTKALTETDIQHALKNAKKGKELAKKEQSGNWTAEFDFQIGDIYQMMSKYDSTHFYFDKAIKYYRTADKKEKTADMLGRKGFTYQNQGMFEKAFQLNMEALNIYESIGDQSGVANSYVRLADIYFYMERPKEGAEYGEKAIAIYQTLGDEEGLANAYQFTGDNYLLGEDYENALIMMNQALVIQKKLEAHPLEIGSLLNSRGNVLKYLERYEESLSDYNESFKIVEELNHIGGISATLANIGDVYIRMGKYEQALPVVLRSCKMQEENGFIANLMENYGHLSNIYKNLGEFENALFYREKYLTIRDSIVSLEKDQATSELRTKYETEKKELLIADQEEQLFRQKIIQWFAFGFVVLLAVILFLMYQSFKLKQKTNKLLEAANNELEDKNRENELLLKEIHHRVKNNLQTISSLLNLQSANIQDATALEAVTESQNRVRSMALIHQKLYQGENLAAVEMKDYFKTMGQAMIESFGHRAEQIALEVEMPELELDVDTAIPVGLIVNELMTNSMKYAFPSERKGKIELSLTQEKDKVYCLRTSDNGVGLSGAKDTRTGKGTGFGSQLIQLLTLQLGGKIEQQSDQGTTTIIRFSPVSKVA